MKNTFDFKDLFTHLIKESMEKTLTSSPLKRESASKDIEALKNNKVTIEKVTEKINTIRSGKSLKDDTVSSNLNEYFNSLTSEERSALFVFLKALAQIFTAETELDNVIDPGDHPPSLAITRKDSSETPTKQVSPSNQGEKTKTVAVNKVTSQKSEKLSPIKPKEK